MGLKGHVMVFSDEGHFADRRDAGLLLGAQLRHTLGGDLHEPTLVVGIPRGGILVAADVAAVLGCDFDVIGATPLVSPSPPRPRSAPSRKTVPKRSHPTPPTAAWDTTGR